MTNTNTIGSHKTSIYTEGGITKIRYHNTEVVKFAAGMIKLDSGGWFTPTTKTRMNQAAVQFDLGYKVYQKDFDWFVSFHNKVILFVDGMILNRIS